MLILKSADQFHIKEKDSSLHFVPFRMTCSWSIRVYLNGNFVAIKVYFYKSFRFVILSTGEGSLFFISQRDLIRRKRERTRFHFVIGFTQIRD